MESNIKFLKKNQEQLAKEIYTLLNTMHELNRTLAEVKLKKKLERKIF